MSLRNRILILLLTGSYFLFSYYVFDGWWYSSIGSVLIIIFSYLIWGRNFKNVTGLGITLRILAKAIILAALIIIFSIIIIKHTASKNGVCIQYTGFVNYYHDIFYILNEEIVLGGIAIYLLREKCKLGRFTTSVALAMAFSLIHYIFYRWIFLESGIIKAETLLVLFLVGYIRNNLIIKYKHIAYSWALHFGWMVIMFGSCPCWINSGERLAEYECFNMFLGSDLMLILAGILAPASSLLIFSKSDPS